MNKHHELYRRWTQIRQTVLNPRAPDYKNMGGLPVVGLDNFERFRDFVESEIGPLPGSEYKLHRKNLSRGWVRNNLEWCLQTKVGKDQRKNIHVTYKRRRQLLIDWCRELNISYWRAYRRYRRGLRGREVFQ